MAESSIKKVNAVIEEIGYRWCGHACAGSLNLILASSRGGHCSIDICEPKKLRGFFGMFSNEPDINYEDGFYAEELKGKHVCAWFEEDGYGKIIGISPILDEDGDEMVEV